MEGAIQPSNVSDKSDKVEENQREPRVRKAAEAEDIRKTSSTYVRADKINLADLDAALDRLNKGKTPERRKKEEWEIDVSKLVLKNVIARGTYGTVYKGVFEGQDVAVKLLDWGEESTMTTSEIEGLRAAFRQEVAVWHKLDHPNVTKFIGASMGNGDLQIPSVDQGADGFVHVASNVCCVVVEYLAGGTLKNFLIRHLRRKLTFKAVMQLALDLSRGLSYLHSQSIIHRDVKSENMLLDKKMNLKIADFGVARVEAQNPKDMTGETGTLGYMAPEVLAGKPYNRKCDVYSFGICLWETYCCDMPYPDLSFAEMTSAVVKQHLRPEIPKCCPSALATVMKRCWDANPDKRPSMDEVVQMLEAIDTSKGGGMIPPDQSTGCFCFLRKGP
ncbi:hypothetical protein KP509_04G055000 [Ceratopteris richardii]|uniref:non-specific serine/threonine protein kinase n=1 Tax=Ceratopteris richardii TaxID=49495 RepID=A0A8T2V0L8_CERRI|nr:hypothetical protein KP509_04G055000 [Ceratopteris richardii]